jgi:hypothetical protein
MGTLLLETEGVDREVVRVTRNEKAFVIHIRVPASVSPSSLLTGQDSEEFAAEVGDAGDHAAPDRGRRGPVH